MAEIDSLYDVYEDVRQKWDMEVSPPHIVDWAPGAPVLSLGQPLCLPVGHHVDGRFQCWLQLRDLFALVVHPLAHEPCLPVADS